MFLILLSWHRIVHVVLVVFARFGGDGDFILGAHNVKKQHLVTLENPQVSFLTVFTEPTLKIESCSH